MPAFPKNNLGGKTWANIMNENDAKAPAVKKRATKKATKKASPKRSSSRTSGPNTRNVRQMRSSFKRLYDRNPNSYIKSRRRRQGRPSKSKSPSPREKPARRGLTPERRRPANHSARSRANHSHRARNHAAPGPKPRAGKVMRECLRDCENEGCQRHKDTADCKFIHKGEPEYNMLRPDQKQGKKGGFAMFSPAPLSKVNTYTSWPGGVDPMARLHNQASNLLKK
jgi:hypothetical protein